MADGGERALGATACFEALPPAIVLAVLALLPVDQRLRCREVCRAWCAALEERSLWTRLDLSDGSGVAAAHLAHAAGLLAAAARAGGQLQSLDVTGCARLDFDVLRAVVGGSAATLRTLRLSKGFTTEQLADLLRAAPQLHLLHAARLLCDSRTRFELLQNEQLFAPLQCRCLCVYGTHQDAAIHGAAAVLALTLRLAVATAPSELYLKVDLGDAAAIGALVDAALAHQVSVVSLGGCRLSAASAPALARLLGGGAVTRLKLHSEEEHEEELWADEAGTALLCDALRANTSLQELEMHCFDALRIPAAGTALLQALTGHASLRTLVFTGNNAHDAHQTVAAALGALVAADTLTYLDVSSYASLGEAALGPLFDALPAVTRLRTLRCFENFSDAFTCNRVLPAVRANGSLRHLLLLGLGQRASVREAQALVNSRRAHN
jgi:hypothetical protein